MAKKKNRKNIEAQVAALPVRKGLDGKVQVLVITSRETGRWVIPKGWPMDDRSDPKAALTEAFEEAGVKGSIVKEPIGTYDYVKVMPKGVTNRNVRVSVYILEVEEELPKWPERKERIRDWVSPSIAAKRVNEPGLKEIIEQLGNQLKLAS